MAKCDFLVVPSLQPIKGALLCRESELMGWKMKEHKRQSNYVLQSENRGWEEDESQLGEGGDHVTGVPRIAKRHNRSQRDH